MHAHEVRYGGIASSGIGVLFAVLAAADASAAIPIRIAHSALPVHVLRHLTNLHRPSSAPSNRVCIAQTGDAGSALETAATEASPVYWVRVRFVSGACSGLEGWVASDAIRVDG